LQRCGQWQRKQKKKKKTGGAAERREKSTVALGGRWVVVLASCGGDYDGEAGVGFGWWLERRRERGREKKLQKQGREAGFWPTLDPIFSSLKPSTQPLFIGGGRG
jgi:hypothetical protein